MCDLETSRMGAPYIYIYIYDISRLRVNLIVFSSTCFEHPSIRPQEDLYMQFYGISFMHPYNQSGRCQDVFDQAQSDIS